MWRWPRQIRGWWAGLKVAWKWPGLEQRLVPGRFTPTPARAGRPFLWDVPEDDLDPDTTPGHGRPAGESPATLGASEHDAGACSRRLRCLSRVAGCVWSYDQVDTLLRDSAAIIPFGFKHADKARAEIHWDGRSYPSDGFERGPWSLRRDLVVEGCPRGYVEVSYTEACECGEGGPFLKEEHDLIQTIAYMLSVGIERRQTRESLTEAEQRSLGLFNDGHDSQGVTERRSAPSGQEKAVEELRTANRELNDFVVLVSHDLKAVHRGMSLLDHWACGDLADLSEAEVRSQVSLLRERVQRLDDLVTVMVKYSKIGRGEESETAVDLQELVQDLVKAVGVPERIAVQIEQPLPAVRTLRSAVVDTFGCLLGNALRQMDQTPGVIRIGCCEEGRFWTFSVSDGGPGIDPQHHQGLFRLFQATPNCQWEDFGAALAIAKRSVEACGGQIRVESTVGRGSTFFFTLPKAQMAEPALIGGGRPRLERGGTVC